MKIFGISMVRNEVDIIRLSVLYHLSLGLHRLLIVDNGSTDGTDEELKRLEQDKPVSWTRDTSQYRQSEALTELAREAHRLGADWIVPFDADEFWSTGGNRLIDILYESKAGALKAPLVNFVQSRDQLVSTPEGMLTMTWRTLEPVGPISRSRELVESHRIGFVELDYPKKCISRPTEEIRIEPGNHHVSGVNGPQVITDAISCFHAPPRSRAVFDLKAEHGRRVEEAGWAPRDAWHVRRWARLQREGSLDLEWAANSYLDGALDVYGERHELVFDPRLRAAISPFLGKSHYSGQRELKKQLDALESQWQRHLEAFESQRRKQSAVVERLSRQLADKDRRLTDKDRRLTDKDRQLKDKGRQLKDKDRRLKDKDRQLSELRKQAKQQSQDVKMLVSWVERLDKGILALLHSRQWKIGQRVDELHRKLMRRPPRPTAQDRLVKVLRQFRDWKESRKHARGDTESETNKGPVTPLP